MFDRTETLLALAGGFFVGRLDVVDADVMLQPKVRTRSQRLKQPDVAI
jgi:hypothetical protein